MSGPSSGQEPGCECSRLVVGVDRGHEMRGAWIVLGRNLEAILES